MPYFLKFEGNKDPRILSQHPEYHSKSGPVEITSWSDPDPLILLNQKLLNNEAGIQTTDINGPIQVGTALAQAYIGNNGVRSSASNSYIDPNPFPETLHILTRAFVTKIIFKRKIAVGVIFERKGVNYKVMAYKEIIISSGMYYHHIS